MKQMLKRQLKGVPEAEQERIISAVEKNPDFFKEIADEVEKRVKGGMGQQEAAMSVMRKRQDEIRKIMNG
ncbi:MAG: hypothetical protein V4526_00030 [Patescibacteria group bacterium]